MEQESILFVGLPAEIDAAVRPLIEDLQLRPLTDAGQKPTVAVVCLDADLGQNVRMVQTLSASGARIAVTARHKDSDLILVAMRAGAREFAGTGEPTAIAAAIRTLARPPVIGPPSTVTAVFPAKGGMGATSIAANLAGFLVARDERTCLVDLDLELGDVLAVLDLPGGYSIRDVMENMRRLDQKLLDTSVLRHRSGIAVLARGDRIEEETRIDAEGVGTLLQFLRQHYGHVLVDGLHGFGDVTLAALDAADRILLLVTQEVAAVRNAQRCIEIFQRLGYHDPKVRLIVNRYQKGSRITKEVVAETTGVPVAATIVNDFALLNRAVNRGSVVPEEAPRSVIARDLEALLPLLDGTLETAPKRGSMLSRFFAPKVAANGA